MALQLGEAPNAEVQHGVRVVEESLRKLPGEPLVPVAKKIGLFLMG